MGRFIVALATVVIGSSVTGCSTSFLMELNACNCFTLRQGVTPEQFEGLDNRTHSLFGPAHKPQSQSTQKFQVGDDVWEVWVYDFNSDFCCTEGDWASASPENGQTASPGSYPESTRQEYVAFRNGRLEAWGRGTLPGTLQRDRNRVEIGSR